MPTTHPGLTILAQLAEFTVSAFTADELKRLFGFWPARRALTQQIEVGGSAESIADAAIQKMEREGLIDAYFDLLREKRPYRHSEIDLLETLWRAFKQETDSTKARGPASALSLPLSAAMNFMRSIAESDEYVPHDVTNSLYLLYAFVLVPTRLQSQLSTFLQEDRLRHTLQSQAPKDAGIKGTTTGYEALWTKAEEFAVRRPGTEITADDMLAAILALRPHGISEYLQMIGATWERFPRPDLTSRSGFFTVPARPVDRGRIVTTIGNLMSMDDPPDAPKLARGDAVREAYYQEVFEEFVKFKVENNESIDNFTYDKFAFKLRAHSVELMKRPDVVDVQFSVYIKDNKAALKARAVRR